MSAGRGLHVTLECSLGRQEVPAGRAGLREALPWEARETPSGPRMLQLTAAVTSSALGLGSGKGACLLSNWLRSKKSVRDGTRSLSRARCPVPAGPDASGGRRTGLHAYESLFYAPARLPRFPGRSCPQGMDGRGQQAGRAGRSVVRLRMAFSGRPEQVGERKDLTRLQGCGARRGRRPGSDPCAVRPQFSGRLGSLPRAGAGAPQPEP